MEPRPPEEYGDHIAGIYDALYPTATYPVDDAVAYLTELAADGAVLELGIGTGRIALPLAAAGVDVRGIDASAAMVDRLRDKEGGADLDVVIGDFGEADLGRGLSVVFVAFNTFFALQDQRHQIDCFHAVAAALGPRGHFVIEAFVPDLARFDRGQRVSAVEVGTQRVVLNTSMLHVDEQRIEGSHIVIADGRADTYPVALRYAWPSELDLMARLAGLELVHRWGGWNRSPFTAASGGHVSVWRAA